LLSKADLETPRERALLTSDTFNPLNIRSRTYRDLLKLSRLEQKQWNEACLQELEALKKREVFITVNRPKNRKVIKNQWVFDIKSDGRKKARLVAKGFSQVEGIDYKEIFSPVVRFETVRLLLALAALEKWYIVAIDVKNAFLYGILEEEIYMEELEGFKTGKDKVWLLKRALYSLKQASLSWWKEMEKSMRRIGFKRIQSDAGVFIHIFKNGNLTRTVIAVVYVDDALFLGSD